MLRKLLAAHATSDASDLLARLPAIAEAPVPAHAGLRPGEHVGPYRLKRELTALTRR